MKSYYFFPFLFFQCIFMTAQTFASTSAKICAALEVFLPVTGNNASYCAHFCSAITHSVTETSGNTIFEERIAICNESLQANPSMATSMKLLTTIEKSLLHSLVPFFNFASFEYCHLRIFNFSNQIMHYFRKIVLDRSLPSGFVWQFNI